MGHHPSASLVYGFAVDQQEEQDVAVCKLRDLDIEKLTPEENDELLDDTFSAFENLATENDLEVVIGYSHEDSNYIICAKEPQYSASEDTESVPTALGQIDPAVHAKLRELAAKIDKEPSWLLVAYIG